MREIIIALIIWVGVCSMLIVLHQYSCKKDIIKEIQQSKEQHNRLHNLIKDSVKMHNYFEAHYEGGYFEPCEVVVECEKFEL